MKAKKVVFSAIMSLIMAVSLCAVSAGALWVDTDHGRKYMNSSGEYVKGWENIDGKKYYFDSNGIMRKGWLKTSSGKYYYLKKDGSAATGSIRINGVKYTFNNKGVWDGKGTKPVIKNSSSKSSTSSTKKVDKEKLKKEYNECKEEMMIAAEALEEFKKLYEEAKAKKDENMDMYYKYFYKANDYKDKKTQDYYVNLAHKYKDMADEYQKVVNECNSNIITWQKKYDKCSNRIVEITAILEGN